MIESIEPMDVDAVTSTDINAEIDQARKPNPDLRPRDVYAYRIRDAQGNDRAAVLFDSYCRLAVETDDATAKWRDFYGEPDDLAKLLEAINDDDAEVWGHGFN